VGAGSEDRTFDAEQAGVNEKAPIPALLQSPSGQTRTIDRLLTGMISPSQPSRQLLSRWRTGRRVLGKILGTGRWRALNGSSGDHFGKLVLALD
jgi:hypothetical protein